MQTYKLYKKGRSLDIADPYIISSMVPDQVDQIAMCIQIGLLCVQGDPQLRPTMRRVVVLLSKKPSHLEEPSRPGIPGSRYRRASRHTQTSSSAAGTSSGSSSRTYGTSLNTNTATGSASGSTSAPPNRGSHSHGSASGSTSTSSSTRYHSRGKRPMEG